MTHFKLHKGPWQVLLLVLLDLDMTGTELQEYLLEIFSQLLGWELGRETMA